MGVITDYTKAMKLMSVLLGQLESSLNPEQYLIDICHVLINQRNCALKDVTTSILHQLGKTCVYGTLLVINILCTSHVGQSVPDDVSLHTVLPSPVDDISNAAAAPVTNIRGNEYLNLCTCIYLDQYRTV